MDRLIRSVRDAGIGPGADVYAELGPTWFHVLRDPDAAAHVLGKLLVVFGPERVLWGTDSIWYGSPQDQIEAFRAFSISEQAVSDLPRRAPLVPLNRHREDRGRWRAIVEALVVVLLALFLTALSLAVYFYLDGL